MGNGWTRDVMWPTAHYGDKRQAAAFAYSRIFCRSLRSLATSRSGHSDWSGTQAKSSGIRTPTRVQDRLSHLSQRLDSLADSSHDGTALLSFLIIDDLSSVKKIEH